MAARKNKKARSSIVGKFFGLLGAIWRIIAKSLGSSVRFIFRASTEMDEAHQRDGIAFLFLIMGLIAAAGGWFKLNNLVGHGIYAAIYGVAGRVGVVIPIFFFYSR